MNASTISTSIFILFGSVIALIYGKAILVPFMFAVLIYFLIRAIHRLIDRNRFIREFIPSWLKNVLSAIIIFSLLGLVTRMVVSNSQQLILSISNYEGNMENILGRIHQEFGIDLVQTVTDKINALDYNSLANEVFNSLTTFLGNMMMIFFYIIFLFIEESSFKKKIRLIFRGERYGKVEEVLENIEGAITHYIGLKTLIALISGICCYVVCLSFGLESPLFWAFLISIMNFIPVIGALMGVFLPFLFSLIQFGEFTTPLILLVVLGTIQTLISNLVEPKIMGDSLNISPLVAILSLVVWGAIWGIIGMVVSVPITVILIILLAQFPKTKAIAILLSHDGRI